VGQVTAVFAGHVTVTVVVEAVLWGTGGEKAITAAVSPRTATIDAITATPTFPWNSNGCSLSWP
jgi:hypothetical protein